MNYLSNPYWAITRLALAVEPDCPRDKGCERIAVWTCRKEVIRLKALIFV
jgi:hypothetical protein